MQARLLNNYTDISSINKWLKKRGHPPISEADMPKLSFIVPGVAACGIRACEGRYGILDSIVTNPLVSPATRDKALNTLFKQALSIPWFKHIIGFTIDDNTHSRALSHGFKQLHYALLTYSKE